VLVVFLSIRTTVCNVFFTSVGTEAEGEALKSQALQLTLRCLSYDFLGLINDDSMDESTTVQVPNAWRPAFEDPGTLQLFFTLFQQLRGSLAVTVLDCGQFFSSEPWEELIFVLAIAQRYLQFMQILVQLGSLRRQMFSSPQARDAYTTQFFLGMRCAGF